MKFDKLSSICYNVLIDGTTGDGTDIGKCPSSQSTYKCLSTGECNVCGYISGVAQGCDVLSAAPVCDEDASTTEIEDSASGKVAKCTACTKSGKYFFDISQQHFNVCKKHILYLCLKRNQFVLDGTAGDGTHIGKCPSSNSNYRCLSNGYCNVCGLISGNAEGCDITSLTPVCDADSGTTAIDDSDFNAPVKVAQCVACKKDGSYS